ncbi:MAG TPA: ABC transporter ATP-binding protein [Candidatus Paceibacterota bacterium]
MKSILSYLKSVRFALGYAFRFAPGGTVLMSVLVVIENSLPYASSFLLGWLVNLIVSGAQSGLYKNVWYVLAFYAFVSAMPAILSNIRAYVGRRRMLTLQMEVDLEFLKMREEVDIANYEDPKFQDLLQRTFRNGPSPLHQLGSAQIDIVGKSASLIVGTVLAIHFNPTIYFIVIAAAIPAFIMDIKYAGKSWSIWSKDSPEQRRLSDLRQHLQYKTLLIETKLLQSGNKLLSWIRKIFSDFAKVQLGLEKNRLWHTSLTDLLSLAGFAGGLVLIMKSVIAGETPVGTLVYMMATLSSVRNSIGSLLETVSGQYENHLIVKDMIEFMNTKPVIIESENPQQLKLSSAPEIVFENVSFKYHNSDKYSLKKINLTLRAGDNIGLVGNNGAGKTTLVKLLCRIYDPTEGRILINGVDLREIATKEWWSYLAVMFQDYATYDFLVKDVIAIGRPDKPTNLTRVIEAAHTSQSHTFIEEWKGKYEHQLGVEFGGKEPSKGQRQKLSIAKTLYRQGMIMILDEPTASVDAESESKIFDSIESLDKNTTALLISHDFSTISACDKIFVLDEAKLIEEGNHKELMAKKGLYAELYNLQAKRFKK